MFPLLTWLVAALVAAALVLGFPAAWGLGGGAAVLVFASVAVWWRSVRPLRRAWHAEAKAVDQVRKAPPAVSAPHGVLEWPEVAQTASVDVDVGLSMDKDGMDPSPFG